MVEVGNFIYHFINTGDLGYEIKNKETVCNEFNRFWAFTCKFRHNSHLRTKHLMKMDVFYYPKPSLRSISF